MLSEEELGEAVRVSLHRLVDDIQPSQRLREAIEPRRRPAIARLPLRSRRLLLRPRALLAALVLVGMIVAGTLIEVGGSVVSASYAVTLESNGSVKITLYQMSGAPGANARLRALGVRAVIVPIRMGCTAKLDLTYIGGSLHPVGRFQIDPNQIPPGSTLVLAARELSTRLVEEAFGQTTGKPPACVPPSRSGAGLGTFTPSSHLPSTTEGSKGKRDSKAKP